ncbi:hypothetical protein SAMN05421833_110141 [Microbispora rosea]|uniref:Uncharacterized protein n=1 Tax=Microbispora rosea TaxID=58117 RepID=A0A1N7BRS4_9ACTN|nr:hypothetical protein SAMN05421833_110141 [Microbispora rosea]
MTVPSFVMTSESDLLSATPAGTPVLPGPGQSPVRGGVVAFEGVGEGRADADLDGVGEGRSGEGVRDGLYDGLCVALCEGVTSGEGIALRDGIALREGVALREGMALREGVALREGTGPGDGLRVGRTVGR